jgi:hypothetical protein
MDTRPHPTDVLCCVQDKLKAVAAAGWTSFDTADIYGPSEGVPAVSQQTLHHSAQTAVATPLPLAACAPTHTLLVPTPTGILGDFQQQWAAGGGPPLQLLTKYVPNIFNSRPTPASVEAAVKRSITNLKVSCRQLQLLGAA